VVGTIKRFEDIVAWQRARELLKEIYSISQKQSFSANYSLKNQMLSSSGSIMDNIAEGFERGGKIEFIHFLTIAKGSAGELRSQLYRSLDQMHIDEALHTQLTGMAEDISKMINGLIKYLNQTEIKGEKYKNRISEDMAEYIKLPSQFINLNKKH
jgi:four helix bundle protein